jgi:hypothetical protein
MSLKILFKEILRWELYRIKFNSIIFFSGLLLLFIISIIKPLEVHGIIHGKAIANYYYAAIFCYGLLVNFVFTIIYIYTFLLKSKLKMNDINDKIYPITKRFILIGGLVANLLIGFLEIFYRFQID